MSLERTRRLKTIVLKSMQYEEMKALFLDVFSNEPWLDKWEDEKQLDSYLKDLTDNSNSLSLVCIDENNQIIGGTLGYVFQWWEGREYFIKELFVAREYQQQGVGSAFLKQIHEIMREKDIKHILLSTDKTVPAYDFYRKNGFSELKDSVFLLRKEFN